jgi:hypothetical protein
VIGARTIGPLIYVDVPISNNHLIPILGISTSLLQDAIDRESNERPTEVQGQMSEPTSPDTRRMLNGVGVGNGLSEDPATLHHQK